MWLAQTSSEMAVPINDAERIDFLIVLIGVILGLSIGKLVNFAGDFLYHRKNGKASWTHGLFLLSMFLFQVYYWWDMWELKTTLMKGGIDFWIFIRMLLIPLCLYCSTALLCPRLQYPSGGEKLSMRDLFEEHCRPFYLFWIVLCVIGISQGMDIRKESFHDPQIYLRITAGILFLIGFLVKKNWLNNLLAVLVFGLLILYITVPLWKGFYSNS